MSELGHVRQSDTVLVENVEAAPERTDAQHPLSSTIADIRSAIQIVMHSTPDEKLRAVKLQKLLEGLQCVGTSFVTKLYADYLLFLRALRPIETDVAGELDEIARELTVGDTPSDSTMLLLHDMCRLPSKAASHVAAVFAGHLYPETATLPLCVHEWYTNTLQNMGAAHRAMSTYVDTLVGRGNHAENFQQFMTDLRTDLTSFHAACVSLATSMAIHTQTTDCAVYIGTTPHGFDGNKCAMTPKIQELLKYSVYQQYFGKYSPDVFIHKNTVKIPTYVSAIDIEKFAEVWKEFWENNVSSLHHQGSNSTSTRGRFQASATDRTQARISLLSGDRHSRCNMRIDREEKHHRLSIDFGHINAADVLAYAGSIGKAGILQEVIMQYSRILDKNGSHAHLLDTSNPTPRTQEFFYPCAMTSPALQTLDQRMALVAAVVLDHAKGIDLFGGNTFGYHCRNGAVDQRRHYDNFDDIVRQFQRAVTNR